MDQGRVLIRESGWLSVAWFQPRPSITEVPGLSHRLHLGDPYHPWWRGQRGAGKLVRFCASPHSAPQSPRNLHSTENPYSECITSRKLLWGFGGSSSFKLRINFLNFCRVARGSYLGSLQANTHMPLATPICPEVVRHEGELLLGLGRAIKSIKSRL